MEQEAKGSRVDWYVQAPFPREGDLFHLQVCVQMGHPGAEEHVLLG